MDARLQSETGRSSINLMDQGVAIGVCISEAVVITPPADLQAVPDSPVENAFEEIKTLQHAIDVVESDIIAMEERLSPLLYDEQLSLFDVYTGRVYVQPNIALLSAYEHLVQEEEEMVNTGLVSDVNPTLKVESDGIGLYRSEVPFMMLNRFPSEEEQRIIYRQILTALSGRPMTMRTLDIGGDKILLYF